MFRETPHDLNAQPWHASAEAGDIKIKCYVVNNFMNLFWDSTHMIWW